MDKIKDINNYISGVLKRPVYADLPNNQFRTYYRKQLVDHIKTKDTNKVIVSYTGTLVLFFKCLIVICLNIKVSKKMI